MAKRRENSKAKPKAKTKSKPKAAKSAAGGSTDDRVIAAAMALVAESGWRGLTLARVADASGVALADLLIPFPTKYHIVNAFQDRIDARMLRVAGLGGCGGDTRDRLFDLLMERLDALAPYKPAMAEIAKESLRDPGALCFVPRMARSMTRALEAAGVPGGGLMGLAKAKALVLIYADAFRVWLKDDRPDQSKTMAALDRGLRRAETAAVRLDALRRRATKGNGARRA